VHGIRIPVMFDCLTLTDVAKIDQKFRCYQSDLSIIKFPINLSQDSF
jgi:hypothetical protein